MSYIELTSSFSDAFIDGTLQILSFSDYSMEPVYSFLEEEEIDYYHKRVKIKFLLPTSSNASLNLLDDPFTSDEFDLGRIYEYQNSKLLLPILPENVNLGTPSNQPRLSVETVYNRQALSDEGDTLFYNKETTKRNIVFSPIYPMVGSPESNVDTLPLYNSINLALTEEGHLSGKMKEIAQYGYKMATFEKFMIINGLYETTIGNIQEDEASTLEYVIKNFDFPIPQDMFYLDSDQELDLSFDLLEQLTLKGIRRSLSKAAFHYDEILQAPQTEIEYLFFKIEKWTNSEPLGEPSEIYLIPATDGNKTLIDAQITEGIQYYYRITAYYASTIMRYFFNDFVRNGSFGECMANVFPVVRMDNVVVFEGRVLNIPPPPLKPHVSFHNSSISKNDIKIYMELQKGSQIEPLTSFRSNTNVIGNNYILEEGQVQYRYTPQPASFEVFRISQKPSSYEDFSNSLIGQFSNTNMTSNMIVKDKIKSNKKYYYTFRTFNNGGSRSNPTAVYEVELIVDSDESKILVNVVDFNPTDEGTIYEEVNFRSLLDISVSDMQLGYDLSNITDGEPVGSFIGNAILGAELGETGVGAVEHKIWGRKFKFRVRSQDSGKIIDFNIKVNLDRVTSEVETEIFTEDYSPGGGGYQPMNPTQGPFDTDI